MTGILCALLGGAPDTNPDAFSFTNATGIEPSTLTTSNTITPVGYAAQAIWSVTNGGTASINGGAYASSGTISPGQSITVRGTSSSSYSTTDSFVVSIGTTQSTWSVTTRAQPTEASYTTAGTYSFIVPSFVTKVSVVCVGGGGGAGGGTGGWLAYGNNITVTPGETITVTVGAGGIGNTGGTVSRFMRGATNLITAGASGTSNSGSALNGGGQGGDSQTASGFGAGGGAGGYSGQGGGGEGASPTSASGGGGAGGRRGSDGVTSGYVWAGAAGGGGGVGLLGQGASGVNGTAGSGAGGQGGSGGNSGGGGGGSGPGFAGSGGSGGLYGAAGGREGYYGNYYYPYDGGFGSVGNGAGGAVRIIWPGNTRLFPSTNTGVI